MWFWKKKEKTDKRLCYVKNEEGKCALVAPGGDGRLLTPFAYDEISRFQVDSFNFYRCMNSGKNGLLDLDGTVIVPCEMDSLEADRDFVILKKGEKYGIYSPYGLLVQPQFDEMGEHVHYVYVRLGDKWGFIDSEDGKFLDENDETIYNSENGMLIYLL